MKPNKDQLAYLKKLEKWAKNNTNEINVDMALTELIERIDNAKCEVN